MRYQSCGCAGVHVQDMVCEGMVCLQKDKNSKSYKNIPTRRICDGYYHCSDKSDENNCDYSDSRGMNCTPSSQTHNGFVPKLYECDSYSDCKYGEDEYHCGFSFGINCTQDNHTTDVWVDRKHICDGEPYCENSEDEDPELCQSRNNIKLTCKEKGSDHTKAIKEINTCYYPRSYSSTTSNNDFLGCEGLLDQMNCTDTNVLNCSVQNHPNTRIRDRWLCNNWQVCDDGIDELCYTLSETCTVHKYMFCDGKIDCPQKGEDEQNCKNKTETNFECQRHLTRDKPKALPIPSKWLCDGVQDCQNGEDEDDTRFNCKKGIECPDLPGVYIKKENFCDNMESCAGSEAELCAATRLSKAEYEKGAKGNDILTLESDVMSETIVAEKFQFQFPCLPGIMKEDSQHMHSKCQKRTEVEIKPERSNEISHYWWNDCNKLNFSSSIKHGLKELFCASYDASLRTQNIAEAECMAEKTVYNRSLGQGGKLMKYMEIENEILIQSAFNCKNKKCLQPNLVCNFIDDCGDGSDEDDCPYSYHCERGFPRTISRNMICDGVFDCSDGSDECSQGCGNNKLLQSSALRYLAIFIGVASFFMNSYSVFQGISMFLKSKSKTLRINHFFMSLIGLGDWTLGIYLLTIASFDIYYDNSYCKLKYEWLTSNTCSFLGILSTFGSTLSVYTMVFVSLYRAIKLAGGKMAAEKEVFASVITGVALVLVVMIIAVLPVTAIFQDYFSNGIWYKNNPMFPTLSDMNSHVRFIVKYKDIKNDTSTVEESWSAITNFFKKLYHNEEVPKGVHQTFYGNDAVCLFKYFVKSSDPQYSFSMMMTVLNCSCFLLITICYTFVLYKMKKDIDVQGMIKDKTREINTKTIQIKIAVITLTDLATWMPFCILAWAYTNGAAIPKEKIYQIAAVILLPMNSIMNPIIYNELPAKLRKAAEQALTTVTQRQTSTSNRVEFGRESSICRNESTTRKVQDQQFKKTSHQDETSA